MECPNCNNMISEEIKFCGKCGISLEEINSDIQPNHTHKENIKKEKELMTNPKNYIQQINKSIWGKYPLYKNIEPNYEKYQFEDKFYNRLTYILKNNEDNLEQYLIVNFNDNGKITAENLSKKNN